MQHLARPFRWSLGAWNLWLAASLPAQIHVNLFNDAGVSDKSIHDAQREVNRILRSAGVAVAWSTCGVGRECVVAGKQYLQVRFYSAASDAGVPVASDVCAFALPAPPPEFGFFIGVFPERVDRRARFDGIDKGRLLGYVIAHEIGHLLLGRAAHSARGIMVFPWSREELDSLRCGRLLFRPREISAIRQNIEARLRGQPNGETAYVRKR